MVPSQTKRQAPPTSSCSLIAMAGMCSGLDWSQTLYFIVSPSLHDQPTGYEILLPLFRIDTEVNSLPMVTHLLSGKTGRWTQAFFPRRPVRHHAALTLGPNGGSACGLCWNVLSLFRENRRHDVVLSRWWHGQIAFPLIYTDNGRLTKTSSPPWDNKPVHETGKQRKPLKFVKWYFSGTLGMIY